MYKKMAFAEKLINHKQLLARITQYGEDPVLAILPLDGLAHAIQPLGQY